MSRHKICRVGDLWSGELLAASAGGQRLLLVRANGAVCAYADRCAHKGVQLSKGLLEGNVLTCCAHGWQFDIATGRGINPENAQLESFEVFVDETDIWVEIDEGTEGPK